MSESYPEPPRAATKNGNGSGDRPDRRNLFVRLYRAQIGIPEPERGSLPDGHTLTLLEKWILAVVALACWENDGKPARLDNLEIAELLGLRGRPESKRARVKRALNGYHYRRTNPETGKRDGERVEVPGMPERAWLVVYGDGRLEARTMEPSSEWWALAGPHLAGSGGNGQSDGGMVQRCTTLDSGTRGEGGTALCPPAVQRCTGGGTALYRPSSIDSETVETERSTLNVQRVSESNREKTEPAPEASPAAPPAEISATNPAPRKPTEAELAEVLGDIHIHDATPEQAALLVELLKRKGVRLTVGTTEGVATLKPEFPAGWKQEDADGVLTAPVKALIVWLKPQIMSHFQDETERKEKLRTERSHAPGQGAAAVPPPVVKGLEARVVNLVKSPAADDSDCLALANDLVQVFRDKDADLSRKNYLRVARGVKNHELSDDAVRGVVSEACKAMKVRSRGALFSVGMKPLWAAVLGGRRAEGGP